MFKANDKVLMCVNDGLATKGWAGIVKWVGSTHMSKNVEVLWDNGKKFYHSYTHLIKKGSFYLDARVVLLHSDGGYKKGIKGTVINYDRTGVKVRWDADIDSLSKIDRRFCYGGDQWHLAKSIRIINDGEKVNPNLLFIRRLR